MVALQIARVGCRENNEKVCCLYSSQQHSRQCSARGRKYEFSGVRFCRERRVRRATHKSAAYSDERRRRWTTVKRRWCGGSRTEKWEFRWIAKSSSSSHVMRRWEEVRVDDDWLRNRRQVGFERMIIITLMSYFTHCCCYNLWKKVMLVHVVAEVKYSPLVHIKELKTAIS